MDAVEFLKERKRLTENCDIKCDDCRLQKYCGEISSIEEYVNATEQWSKDCPEETVFSDFVKKFPNFLKDTHSYPNFCPESLNGKYKCLCDECAEGEDCVKCWNQPVIKD